MISGGTWMLEKASRPVPIIFFFCLAGAMNARARAQSHLPLRSCSLGPVCISSPSVTVPLKSESKRSIDDLPVLVTEVSSCLTCLYSVRQSWSLEVGDWRASRRLVSSDPIPIPYAVAVAVVVGLVWSGHLMTVPCQPTCRV